MDGSITNLERENRGEEMRGKYEHNGAIGVSELRETALTGDEVKLSALEHPIDSEVDAFDL